MNLILRSALALILLAISALLAPLPETATAQTGQRALTLPVHASALVVETSGGPRSFAIEIADTSEKRSRGLMFRQSMPADRGMLFVFEETRAVGFWMQNTSLPLDLVFIAEDGTVRGIRRGTPFSTDLISSRGAVRFVLELNEGIAQKTGIAVGDRVRHPVIDRVARPG